MQRVVLLSKGSLERVPPMMMLAQTLRDLGNEVVVICSDINAQVKDAFTAGGIQVVETCPRRAARRTVLTKVREWATFHSHAWRWIDQHAADSLLWVGSADTALALGRRLLARPFIFEILELYDRNKRYLTLMAPYARQARCVVVPEMCRAAIFRVWFQLDATPTVLPNKPYHVALTRDMPVTHAANRQEMARIAGRKLVLYQAQNVRMDTLDIAHALREMGDAYVLGILGRIRDQAMFARLRQEYPELAHFDYMPAPEHLEVTSHAHIGVLMYNYESLNNIFCAPNKTWEFAALQIPMLTHELPMLSQQLEHFHAGETFRVGDVGSIITAIQRIDADYDGYRQGADRLFHSVDVPQVVQSILATATQSRT